MNIRFFILVLLFCCAGCEKDNDPPIIEPGPYYPVYPNSWWKYLYNDSIVLFDTTSDDYIVNYFKIDEEPWRYSDPARVPFVNGHPVYGYNYVELIDFPDTQYDGIYELWPILSETVGSSFWISWFDGRYDQQNQLVTVKSKTFNGTDSVLLLVSGWTTVQVYDYYIYPEVRYRTFVKGVGCISDIVVDTVTSDTLSKKMLIDYYVNHPF
jgi:hypothetical protein